MYQQVKQEYQRLQQEIQELQSEIDGLPAGKLVCAKNGGKYRWYNSDGKDKVYIPRKHRKMAEQLALKKYYSLQKGKQHSAKHRKK